MLNAGYLPRIYLSDSHRELLASYVGDCLKEEIAAEGLVRNLPVFSEFLNMASLSDGDLVNFSSIARDYGVSGHTIQGYFQILVDTLLGTWLPPFRMRPKRRAIGAPKFYFSDVGVVNLLAKRGHVEQGSRQWGEAFENWVFHELQAHCAYSGALTGLAHWRLPSGIEVDFVIGDSAAIEAKSTRNVTTDHLRGLRHFNDEYPKVHRRIVVCLEPRVRKTEDGILILPARDFADLAASGELFA